MKGTINSLREKGQIAIGIGPMSKACVDGAYRYSQEHSQPIMLIASRRQVECKALGKGYVNNWTSEEFGEYCKKKKEEFPSAKIFLCRDHGGPWQGTNEEGMGLEEAMARAATSYIADIDSGFDMLHIDPSLCKDGNLSMKAVLDNSIKLLRQCSEHAAIKGRSIAYEIGTEENSGSITTPESFAMLSRGMDIACTREKIDKPIFIVGQTMSLVKEMRQIGEINAKNTRTLIDTAAKYGFLLKEHNADYLTEYQFSQRLRLGVPAMNVAPEFGVLETAATIDFCMESGNFEAAQRLLSIALDSGKWKKWVINPDHVSEYDKALMAGHYCFSKPEWNEVLDMLDRGALREKVDKAIWARLEFYFARNRKK